MSSIKKSLKLIFPYLKKQTIMLESSVYPGATRIFLQKIKTKFKIGKISI